MGGGDRNEQRGAGPKRHVARRLGPRYVTFSFFISNLMIFLFVLDATTNEWVRMMGRDKNVRGNGSRNISFGH